MKLFFLLSSFIKSFTFVFDEPHLVVSIDAHVGCIGARTQGERTLLSNKGRRVDFAGKQDAQRAALCVEFDGDILAVTAQESAAP